MTYRPQVIAGDYKISIQGSSSNYSNPRQYLENIEDYIQVEIAIFKGKVWVQPREDELIKNFSRYDELIDVYEYGCTAVGAYVDYKLVKELITYLKENKS